MKQKFNINDIVKYDGNIYQIVGLEMGKQSSIYDVKCLKNNFPDEPVSSAIDSCAEDKMELVDFNEPDRKQQWIEKAQEFFRQSNCLFSLDGMELSHFIDDFRKYMEGE